MLEKQIQRVRWSNHVRLFVFIAFVAVITIVAIKLIPVDKQECVR